MRGIHDDEYSRTVTATLPSNANREEPNVASAVAVVVF